MAHVTRTAKLEKVRRKFVIATSPKQTLQNSGYR